MKENGKRDNSIDFHSKERNRVKKKKKDSSLSLSSIESRALFSSMRRKKRGKKKKLDDYIDLTIEKKVSKIWNWEEE